MATQAYVDSLVKDLHKIREDYYRARDRAAELSREAEYANSTTAIILDNMTEAEELYYQLTDKVWDPYA